MIARLATAEDAAEVVRPACVMFVWMGHDDPGDAWRASAAAHFDARGGDLELHATAAGEPLYRSLGSREGTGAPPLRRRAWDPPPAPR
jgi:hypothetical protein